MSGTSIWGKLDFTNVASVNRIRAGLEHYLTYVVVSPGVEALKAMTFEEYGMVNAMVTSMRTNRQYTLLLRASLYLIDAEGDRQVLLRAEWLKNIGTEIQVICPNNFREEYAAAEARFILETQHLRWPSDESLKYRAPGVYERRIVSTNIAGRIMEELKSAGLDDIRDLPHEIRTGKLPEPFIAPPSPGLSDGQSSLSDPPLSDDSGAQNPVAKKRSHVNFAEGTKENDGSGRKIKRVKKAAQSTEILGALESAEKSPTSKAATTRSARSRTPETRPAPPPLPSAASARYTRSSTPQAPPASDAATPPSSKKRAAKGVVVDNGQPSSAPALEDTRRCNTCFKTKAMTEFRARANHPTEKVSYCKACQDKKKKKN